MILRLISLNQSADSLQNLSISFEYLSVPAKWPSQPSSWRRNWRSSPVIGHWFLLASVRPMHLVLSGNIDITGHPDYRSIPSGNSEINRPMPLVMQPHFPGYCRNGQMKPVASEYLRRNIVLVLPPNLLSQSLQSDGTDKALTAEPAPARQRLRFQHR